MSPLFILISTAVPLFYVVTQISGDAESDLEYPDLPANYSRVTCYFNEDTCGWTNVGGNYTLTWRRHTEDAQMYLSMDGDAKGRLASPWLDPVHNYRCQLQFDCKLRRVWPWKDCQLALIRESVSGQEDNLRVITGTGFSTDTITETIDCATDRFRLVFEGWESCGSVFGSDEMRVDDINFILDYIEGTTSTHGMSTMFQSTTAADETENPPTESSTTGSEIPSSSPSTHDVISSTNVDVTSSRTAITSSLETSTYNDTEASATDPLTDGSSSGLESGPLAGIVVAAILVPVVVIVIIVMVMIRRRKDKAKASSDKGMTSAAMVNSAYSDVPDDLSTIGPHGMNGRNHSSSPAEGDLELGDLQQSCTTGQQTNNNATSFYVLDAETNFDRPNQDHTPVSHPPAHLNTDAPDSAIYVNVEQPQTPSKGSDGHSYVNYTSGPSSVAVLDDTYDHTSQVPRQPESEDTYDHTNGQPPPSMPEKTQDRTRGKLPPSVSHNSYVQMDRTSEPQPSVDTLDNHDHIYVQHRPKSTTDVYAQPSPRAARKQLPRKAQDPPTSSEDAAAIFAQAGTADYEAVGDVGQTMRSSVDDDSYNRLDVKGDSGREEVVVGGNVYDHAKDDNYDSLHEEDRRRRQQRELAQGDYSHL